MYSNRPKLLSDVFFGLSESLALLVARRFSAAKESGALVFSMTEVTTISTSGIPVKIPFLLLLLRSVIALGGFLILIPM